MPRLNPDGSVRLNARQRRTLRRAQERAVRALLEAQAAVHGISPEQVRWWHRLELATGWPCWLPWAARRNDPSSVCSLDSCRVGNNHRRSHACCKAHLDWALLLLQAANNLASAGVASMLLGSPPHAHAPVHSPLRGVPYMAAPMPLSPGAMPPPAILSAGAYDYGMLSGMTHPVTLSQQQDFGGFDPMLAAAYGSMSFGGPEAGMQMPGSLPMAMHASPPLRQPGSHMLPGGLGGAARSGGYRGAPGGGRTSRFAPAEGVVAF
jgi:hypothetical protein